MFAAPQLFTPTRKQVVAAAPTWTKTDAPAIQNIAYGANDATFTSVAINNASSANTVVVKVLSRDRVMTGVTIGGDTMTKAVEADGASIWYITGHTYTTPNIVTSAAAGVGYIGITAGVLTGATATPTDSSSRTYQFVADPQLLPSVTIPASGFALAAAYSANGALDPTWDNMTEDYDINSGSDMRITTAYSSAAGSLAGSLSGYSTQGAALCIACWGP